MFRLRNARKVKLSKYPLPDVKTTLPKDTLVSIRNAQGRYLVIVAEGQYIRWTFLILAHQKWELFYEQKDENP